MRIILHARSFLVLGALILIGLALWLLFSVMGSKEPDRITARVDRGTVAEYVSVSGVVKAENTATLSFPVSGIVTGIFVSEGDLVEKGDLLTTLASAQLVAERKDATASLQKTIADKDELLAGPRAEARSVTNQTITNAETNLARVIAEEAKKVDNAQLLLRTSGLSAYSILGGEQAVAPTITGTYTCTEEGAYSLRVYSSGSASGYSYTLTGLESGTFPAYIQSPGTLGTCGLFIQFDEGSLYQSSEWIVEIPNTRSAGYQTNLNAYNLALKQQANAVETAENTLLLAREQATLDNASPRSESLTRANANVLQAQARIDAIDAQLADRSIVAPFDGIITDVSIVPGETATTKPVITLLASDAFELTARIPEIDITKIREGQEAAIVFDARPSEIIDGYVDFISPLAIEIDGVAYFQAKIRFTDSPEWLRSGLNADIDIIIQEETDVLRVPKRFIIEHNGAFSVLTPSGKRTATTAVEVAFSGNDGYVSITGLSEGTTIVAP